MITVKPKPKLKSSHMMLAPGGEKPAQVMIVNTKHISYPPSKKKIGIGTLNLSNEPVLQEPGIVVGYNPKEQGVAAAVKAGIQDAIQQFDKELKEKAIYPGGSVQSDEELAKLMDVLSAEDFTDMEGPGMPFTNESVVKGVIKLGELLEYGVAVAQNVEIISSIESNHVGTKTVVMISYVTPQKHFKKG